MAQSISVLRHSFNDLSFAVSDDKMRYPSTGRGELRQSQVYMEVSAHVTVNQTDIIVP